jgi:molybdopterin biosynthesis enzyme MoaB
MKIGRLTISDRASAGIYADRSGPEIENVLREFLGGEAVLNRSSCRTKWTDFGGAEKICG